MKKINMVIFDWAGTAVDYGCMAPVNAFYEAFLSVGIEATNEEIREPMGLLKRDHIRTMLQMDRIHDLWIAKYGKEADSQDIETIYHVFEEKLMESLKNYATPKPGTLEVAQWLRDHQIKIGSTTGYTDSMMAVVVAGAKAQGYAPDAWFSPDSVGGIGRPYPYMIFRNMMEFQIPSMEQVLKIGDTTSDMREGKNAGVCTVGVLEGSSAVGLSEEEYEKLSEDERDAVLKTASQKLHEAGADYVIRQLTDLPGVIEKIEKM